MSRVGLPDGTYIDFPEGMSDGDITSVLADYDSNRPAAPPRDTTIGEKAGGLALDLGIGTMRATKAIPDLASFVLPDAATNPISEFFERGIDAAEGLKPEAFKEKQKQTFIERDEQGGFAGFQLPSFEHLAGITTSSIPNIPAFLVGGGAAATGLKALPYLKQFPKVAQALGFGTVNAALVAPDQWRQTYKEAIDSGMSEPEARESADAAALMTAGISGVTGAAGGAISSRLGAGSSNLPTAVAKGFIGEAPFEGIEEAGQSAAGDVALNKPVDLVNALDAGLSGFGAGGVPGAGIAGLEFLTQPETQAGPEPVVEPEAPTLPPEAPVVEPITPPGLSEPEIEAVKARLREQGIAGQAPVIQEVDRQASQRQPERAVSEVTAPETTLREQVAEVRAAEKVRQEEHAALEDRPETAPPRPPDLLQIIANGRKLDMASFQGDLSSGRTNVFAGGFNSFVFAGKDRGGMTPEQLLEFMQEEGFLPENDPDSPNKIGAHDAVELLNQALRGERIIHPSDADAEVNFLEFERFEEELARMDEPQQQEAEEFFNESQGLTDEELDAQLEEAFNAGQQDEASDTQTDQGGQDTRDQAGLLAEPTAEETNRAAEEAKSAERDGLGREEVRPEEGEGELFAGNEPGTRPEQNTIFTEEKADAARERLKSKVGTVRSGVDPEMLADMTTLAGYHIERGARTFATFSKAMIEDVGEWIKPHLKKLFADAQPKAETEAAPKSKPKKRTRPAPAPQESETTSTKNVVTDAERAARDLDPVMQQARVSNPDTIAKAEQAIKDNPDIIDETIERLNNDPEPSIDVLTEAILFIAKVDIRREMRRLSEKAAGQEQPSGQGVVGTGGQLTQKYADAMARQNEIDQATHASGAVWGRLGQLRSRMMNDDYSFDAQVSAMAAKLGGTLTDEQLRVTKEQAKEIESLTGKLEKANQAVAESHENFWSEDHYQQLAERFAKASRKQTKKQVRKKAIKTEVDWLLSNSHRLNALPVDMVYHMGRLGGLIIADGANTSAEWVAEFRKRVGDKFYGKIEGDIDEIYAIAQDSFHKDQAELVEQTLNETKDKAEALGEIGEELTHKLVYDLARLHILQGMRGENNVMAAVHADLEQHFEGLSERDVRRLFSEYGKATFPSQAEDKVALRELRVLVRLQESIDRLRKDSLDPKRTGPQRDKATQNVREKQRELNDLMRRRARLNPVPSREKLASIDEQRVTRLTNRIADLEKEIATGEKKEKAKPVPDSERVTKLKAKVAALKDHLRQIEEAKKPKLTPEEKYNVLRGKQLRRELAEVARRLRENDYSKRTRKEPPSLSEANKELRAQVVAAKIKLHEKQAEWIRSQYHPIRKFTDFGSQLINLSRAAITSIDLSAVLRQGGFKMMANPSVAIRSFIPMMKALKNDANANAVNDEIVNRPNFDLYRKAKLHLSEQDSAHPTKMEEVYMGRWQRRVPGIAASGRAYVTFLNKLRADSFDAALETFAKKGESLSIEEMRQLASYINNATGRFDLSKGGATAGQGLSNIFFAPRWMLSRFAMIMGAPMWGASPRMRRFIAGEYVRFALGFGTLFGLAALAFAGNSDDDDDQFWELDPRSSDFGKIRIGNTRLDMAAGLSQPAVFLARVISGGRKNSKGEIIPIRDSWRFGVPEGAKVGFGQDNGADVIWRFTRSKFAPPISAVTNISAGENVVGETYEDRGEFGREVLGLPAGLANNPAFIELMGLSTPLSMRDFYDALQEQGYSTTAALQILATLGVSMNTYDSNRNATSRKKERPQRKSRPKRREKN